jgi:hypothetical protein
VQRLFSEVWDGRWRNRKKFAILFGMRMTKQILAFLLAAALVAGGTVRGMAAAEACPPAHHGDSQPVHAEHHAHGDHDNSGGHAHQHHPAKKQEPSHKSCLECCGICVTATSGLSAAPSFSVHRFGSAISYSLESGVWSGQTVLVDPGIPKHIV